MGQRGSCLLVSLLVLSLALEAHSTLFRALWVHDKICRNHGIVHSPGYVLRVPGDCWKLRCGTGGWHVDDSGCLSGGVCHPVGSTFMENCTTYNCTERTLGSRIFYRAVGISGGCEFKGVCHPVNSTFADGCSFYICRNYSHNGNITYRTEEVLTWCLIGGVCHSLGSTFTENCTTYTCTAKTVSFSARAIYEADVISQGCEFNGVCYPVNWSFAIGCLHYICRKYSRNGNITYRTEKFIYRCSRGDVCQIMGSTFTENCTTYTCTAKAVVSFSARPIFEADVISQGCEDNNGTCHASGSLVSRMGQDGVVRHN